MNKKSIKRAAVALVTAFVVLQAAGVVQAAISQLSSKDGKVKVARADQQMYAEDSWVNVPGTSMNVEYGKTQLMVFRFTSLGACIDNGSGYCEGQVRILVDGVAASPQPGYLGLADPAPAWQAVAIDRSIQVSAGSHNVQVQAKASSSDTMSLDNYHFTLQAYPAA